MKKFLPLLVAALSCSSAIWAQSRLVSMHSANYDGTTSAYIPDDSVAITYAANNTQVGGAGDYNINRLKYTESNRVLYDMSVGGYYKYDNKKFQYDAAWNKTKETIQERRPILTGPLTDRYQLLMTYDANGNELTNIQFTWNTANSVWDSSFRTTSTYDANNHILFQETEHYISGVFVGQSRRNYTYDANGNLTLYLAENWVTAINAYDSSLRQISTFNASGYNDTLTFQTYNRTTMQWENSSRAYYIYNGSVKTTYIHQYWRNNMWENGLRYEYFVDAQGKYIGSIYDSWNTTTNLWDKSTKDTVITHAASPNKAEEYVYYNWDAGSSSYVKSRNAMLNYNADDYLTLSVGKTWNSTQSMWEPSAGDDSTIYRYQPVVGIKAIAQQAPTVILYPNPSMGSTIQVQVTTNNNSPYTISIYDMQGRLLVHNKEDKAAKHTTVSIPQLGNGQYIMEVATKDGKTTKQFSVIR